MTNRPNQEHAERLGKTDEGRGFLLLLSMFPTQARLARELGIEPRVITQCIQRGQASRNLALLAEKKLGISKESIRPDLSADDWSLGTPGPRIGLKPSHDNYDQQTLKMLADHFGSVRALCEAAQIKVANYHTWLSRGRIAALMIPRLHALNIPEDLKARLLVTPE